MGDAPTKVKHISPMLVVEDMDVTVGFYAGILGFTVSLKSDGYSILERDGQTIHLTLAENDRVMKHVQNHASIYVEVEGIDALWANVRMHKAEYLIRDLFEQPYGMREFHISDPNNCLVFVGESKIAK